MSSINKVILVGNLGRDPEIRRTQNGTSVANFTVATSETWRDKQTGEKKERTEWHRVAVFNEGLVRIAEQYLKKGSKVYIEGALQTKKWTDQNGQEKQATDIVLQGFNSSLTMLDRPQQSEVRKPDPITSGRNLYSQAHGKPVRGNDPRHEDIDDEIPF